MVVFFVGSAIVLTVVGWSLQLRDAFAGKLVGALKTNGELQIDWAVLGGRHDRFSSRVGFTRTTCRGRSEATLSPASKVIYERNG